MCGKSGAHALPPSLHFYSPVGKQEDKALSFQEQTSKDQITVPWDLTNPPLHTASLPRPPPRSTPALTAVVPALPHSGAAALQLQLKWFSKDSARGNPNQLFPSSQQCQTLHSTTHV